MKISELITMMEAAKAEHGDIEIHVFGSDKWGYAISGSLKGYGRYAERRCGNGSSILDYPEHIELFCEHHKD